MSLRKVIPLIVFLLGGLLILTTGTRMLVDLIGVAWLGVVCICISVYKK